MRNDLRERAALDRVRREELELKIQLRRSELVEADQVARELADAANAVKARLRRIPSSAMRNNLRAIGRLEGDRIVLRIPRELPSPNTWNGRHWRYKHQLSQTWEQELLYASFEMAAGVTGHAGSGAFSALAVLAQAKRSGPSRKRVSVTREVPSARHYIRDDDNLRFSVKPLLDALKRLGYIRNDSRKWLELPTPEQQVSADGHYWTDIIIEAAKEPRS